MTICFNEAVENKYYKAILSQFNKLKLPKEEIEQYKLICLWESINSFNPEKSAFQTHLYNNCRFTILKFFTKENRYKKRFTELNYEPSYNHEFDSILEDLPNFYRIIIEDRFIHNLSILEMSRKYNISQKIVNKILEEVKEIIRKENVLC